ncbi:hypothetical protein P152DRAFT_445280 [Eremomyces bilateralis CBS 781.70]|uniref:Uncharacterized protein n=1 Tax=Eremomyces bilateralis CBS 781.70 TaxID=1392243 RepID=A0A6G1GGG4_9PEZI|nr:uncharacterized protein P152DRAFT_445280 [Eremomyces bilateralis CBS 781.70]KAF1817143.1 hypothetical protein P152DRAFT_445280 [Eremomyces bilateralis CBS 781.70]
MPPSPLHPRSSQTLSLFTSTLLLSFLVVSLPHMIPCPSDTGRRRAFADGEMDGVSGSGSVRNERRRRRVGDDGRGSGCVVAGTVGEEIERGGEDGRRRRIGRERERECPVPKPGGVVGRWMGWEGRGERESLIVKVERTRRRGVMGNGDGREGES